MSNPIIRKLEGFAEDGADRVGPMARASAFLDPLLSRYLAAHVRPADPLLAELVAETVRGRRSSTFR